MVTYHVNICSCSRDDKKKTESRKKDDTIIKFPLQVKVAAINYPKFNSSFFRFVLFCSAALTVIFVLDSLGFAPNNYET